MSDNTAHTPEPAQDAYVFHALGKALTWDYARAAFAIFVVVGVASVMAPWTIAWFIMIALLIAFVGYLLNTVYRHGLRLELSDAGVTSGWRNPLDANGPVLLLRRHLSWDQLTDINMRYFSRKRDEKQESWIMLRLEGRDDAGAPVTITFDGAHEGFRPVLAQAWDRARAQGLALDDTTLANLEALGFLTTEPIPWTS